MCRGPRTPAEPPTGRFGRTAAESQNPRVSRCPAPPAGCRRGHSPPQLSTLSRPLIRAERTSQEQGICGLEGSASSSRRGWCGARDERRRGGPKPRPAPGPPADPALPTCSDRSATTPKPGRLQQTTQAALLPSTRGIAAAKLMFQSGHWA